MKKDMITFQSVKKDLERIILCKENVSCGQRISYIIPCMVLGITMCAALYTQFKPLSIIPFAVALYHTIRCACEIIRVRKKRALLTKAIRRGNIVVTVETLARVADETVYVSRMVFGHGWGLSEIKQFYFQSGKSWLCPHFRRHYKWSRENYISTEGLDNTSLVGDEFYYITLGDHNEISYVYPCKMFELDRDFMWEDQ